MKGECLGPETHWFLIFGILGWNKYSLTFCMVLLFFLHLLYQNKKVTKVLNLLYSVQKKNKMLKLGFNVTAAHTGEHACECRWQLVGCAALFSLFSHAGCTFLGNIAFFSSWLCDNVNTLADRPRLRCCYQVSLVNSNAEKWQQTATPLWDCLYWVPTMSSVPFAFTNLLQNSHKSPTTFTNHSPDPVVFALFPANVSWLPTCDSPVSGVRLSPDSEHLSLRCILVALQLPAGWFHSAEARAQEGATGQWGEEWGMRGQKEAVDGWWSRVTEGKTGNKEKTGQGDKIQWQSK